MPRALWDRSRKTVVNDFLCEEGVLVPCDDYCFTYEVFGLHKSGTVRKYGKHRYLKNMCNKPLLN